MVKNSARVSVEELAAMLGYTDVKYDIVLGTGVGIPFECTFYSKL